VTAIICTGGEFATDAESRLSLRALPAVAWPFATGAGVPASMRAANGLRVDPQWGPWIPQVGATPVTQVQRGADSTLLAVDPSPGGVYEFALEPWYLTNPSAYQQMAFTGWVEFGVTLSVNAVTWIEQWGNVAYVPAPGAQPGGTVWGPVSSEAPAAQVVWHRSSHLPVQAVVDIADQAALTVRHGVHAAAGGAGLQAQVRDWWVGLYGMTYLLDPGPVG